jgi:hypothetical protein
MGINTMNKVSRLKHKSLGLEAPQEPHLLQALKGAKLPATQSALSRISSLKANFGYLPGPPITDTKSTTTDT